MKLLCSTSNSSDLLALFIFVLFIFSANCAKWSVKSADDLRKALAQVLPGDEIELNEPSSNDTNYPLLFGNFVASRNGTVEHPITIYGRSHNVGLTTNASFVSALQIIGMHWVVRGFRISTLPSNGVALGLFRSQWMTVHDLEISSSTYGIDVWGGHQILIRNCRITSAYISIRIVGDTIPIPQSNVRLVANRLIYSGYSTPNGSSSAIGIFVTDNQGSSSNGLIENNLFQWTNAPHQFWVYLGGRNYTVRNNTGSTVGYAGFRVTWSSMAAGSGSNNTFRQNHCKTVSNGYCISVDDKLINSTCIYSDNTFVNAIALSNMVQRCDDSETCQPETVTTAVSETSVQPSHQCPGMTQVKIITTTTTIALIKPYD